MPICSPMESNWLKESLLTPSGSVGISVDSVAVTWGSTALMRSMPSFAAVAAGTAGSRTAPTTRPAIRSALRNVSAANTPLGVFTRETPIASRRSARRFLLSAEATLPTSLHFAGSSATPSPECAEQ
jgi:hypothetical protein